MLQTIVRGYVCWDINLCCSFPRGVGCLGKTFPLWFLISEQVSSIGCLVTLGPPQWRTSRLCLIGPPLYEAWLSHIANATSCETPRRRLRVVHNKRALSTLPPLREVIFQMTRIMLLQYSSGSNIYSRTQLPETALAIALGKYPTPAHSLKLTRRTQTCKSIPIRRNAWISSLVSMYLVIACLGSVRTFSRHLCLTSLASRTPSFLVWFLGPYLDYRMICGRILVYRWFDETLLIFHTLCIGLSRHLCHRRLRRIQTLIWCYWLCQRP